MLLLVTIYRIITDFFYLHNFYLKEFDFLV